MNKFLLRAGITAAVLTALLFLVNLIYVNTDYYRNLNGMDKYSNVPEHLDIVSFGASHSQASYLWGILPEGINAFSMALGGQSLMQDAAWLDYYSDRIDEDTIVIIDVMFNSLYGGESVDDSKYYQILPAKYICGWNIEDAIRYAYVPILGNRQDGIEAIEMSLFGRKEKEGDHFGETVKKATESVKSEVPTDVIEGWTLDEMLTEGKRRASVKMEESPYVQSGPQYEALEHMLEVCTDKKCRVIVTTTPTTPYFYDGFDKEYLERFYTDLTGLCDKYNVEYVDYTGDERFISDYRMWLDTDHLNGIGGEYFTKIFIEENNILR